jgi:hypothetical protein
MECGNLSAKLIKALSEKDTNFLLNSFTAEETAEPEFEQNIENCVSFFNGNPLFTERDDGLYSDGEHDFWYRTSYELQPNKSAPEKIYTIVLVFNIETDTGETYNLCFGAYFNYSDRQFESFDFLVLINSVTDERAVANYLDYDLI